MFNKGGHAAQALILADVLEPAGVDFIITKCDELSPLKLEGREVRKVTNLRNPGESVFKAVLRFPLSFVECLLALWKSKSLVVISTGASVAIPALLAARVLGRKAVFIESWSRVYKPSLSGRVLYPLVPYFFVQWPEMLEHYPRAKYMKRLRK